MRFMDIRSASISFQAWARSHAGGHSNHIGHRQRGHALCRGHRRRNRKKYPLPTTNLPRDAIVDPNLAMNMPRALTAFGGIDAVTHAIEAYVSIMATEFTDGHALQA